MERVANFDYYGRTLKHSGFGKIREVILGFRSQQKVEALGSNFLILHGGQRQVLLKMSLKDLHSNSSPQRCLTISKCPIIALG